MPGPSVQAWLDEEWSEDQAADEAALVAALAADAAADAAVLKAKDDEIVALKAALKACQDGGGGGDTTPPPVPTGLNAAVQSSSAITLTWAGSSDATSYEVFRGGVSIGTRVGTSYADTGLTAGTSYTYTVKAKDAAGNVSAMSLPVSATTSGVVPPTGAFDVAACKANAGHKGAVLTTYTGPRQITVNNTVITNKQINGQLDIRGSGFIMRNCKMNYTDAWGVYSENAAGPVLIEDCTFVGAGAGGFSVAPWLGFGTIRRCDISGSSMGMNLQRVCTVQANWIHGLARQPGDHYDGISMMGSNKDSLIQGNLIETPSGSVTAHVFISGQFAACSNNRVEGNRMTGSASFPIYSETHNHPVTKTTVINNEMAKGDYGSDTFFTSYVYDNGNSVTHSGNKRLNGTALD